MADLSTPPPPPPRTFLGTIAALGRSRKALFALFLGIVALIVIWHLEATIGHAADAGRITTREAITFSFVDVLGGLLMFGGAVWKAIGAWGDEDSAAKGSPRQVVATEGSSVQVNTPPSGGEKG